MAGVAGGLLMLAGAYVAALGPAPRVIGGPFALTNGAGNPVTDRSFAGKYLLIYFGYTHCDDICPTTLTAVAEALDTLGARADRVQPLFITIDPRRDTAAAVAAYAAGFTPRLIGLTGTPQQIDRVAREFHVASKPDHDGRIDHSSVLYLMAPDGGYLAPVRADIGAAELARVLEHYLS